MDILCAPSQTTAGWREQFGRMLIEAFACGVPVVASDSGEIPYVVGNAGVIVSEGDAAGWSNTLASLIADAGLRGDFGRLGRERAVAVFDWSVVARQHSAFFEEVIAGSLAERGCAA
jgi:glycosyltransferase involved in cell wall biosynthesis